MYIPNHHISGAKPHNQTGNILFAIGVINGAPPTDKLVSLHLRKVSHQKSDAPHENDSPLSYQLLLKWQINPRRTDQPHQAFPANHEDYEGAPLPLFLTLILILEKYIFNNNKFSLFIKKHTYLSAIKNFLIVIQRMIF